MPDFMFLSFGVYTASHFKANCAKLIEARPTLPGILDHFSIPKSRVYERPNPGICTYYQLQFVIVHRVWHWQLTRHALNIKKTWDWLFDCLYRLSKLVEIQMINRISKKNQLPHTHALSFPDLLDSTGVTYVHPTENRDLAIQYFFASFRKFVSWSQNRKIRWLLQNQREIYSFYDSLGSCTSVVFT